MTVHPKPAAATAAVGGVAPPAGAHGGDGAALARRLGVAVDAVLDLSASLNPFAPDPGPVLASHLGALGRYPDPAEATVALAAALEVDPDRLVLTNGGAEAIALVAAETGPGQVDEPDFALYRRHLPGIHPGGPRWRSNPHNPSGRLAPPEERAAVWDEAFWPLATGRWSRGDVAEGSIVLGSLTKLLACPGLRVGYAICPDAALARRLSARQPAWSVNGLVCAAMADLLATVDLPGWSRAVAASRSDLVDVLARAGHLARPSDANWVLVDAPGLRDGLAAHGVLVRDCASFGMPGTVRIAVPGPVGLERLAAALDAVAGAGSS